MFRRLQPTPTLPPFEEPAADAGYLCSNGYLKKMITRERLRSDRSRSSFALVTLALPSPWQSGELHQAARVLRDRLRATDDVGLLDLQRLAILLPETPPAGAWKVADDVSRLLSRDMRRFEVEVFAYPNPGERQDRMNDIDELDVSDSDRSPHKHNFSGTHGEIASANGKSPPRDCIAPMQSLFVRPLPAWKRALDILSASAALIVLSPLLLLIGLAVKATSRGPLIYAQQRDGQAGRRFHIYKFRTMIVDADAMKAQLRSLSEQDGPAFKLKNDPRVTPFGRFLRRTCLDELPQLFNVLRGDMTLVGPRPMCSKEARECAQWQRRRLDVTPGLTCIWQIQTGPKPAFDDWMRMDLRYSSSYSFWHDLKLIAMTIPAIMRRDGVY